MSSSPARNRPRTRSGKKTASTTDAAATGPTPSELIDDRIAQLGDWRGVALSRARAVIRQADPEVIEEVKWRGVPVWSHEGLICTGETYKNVVKLTFARGAALHDPKSLFNSSLEGNTRRAIDIHEGEQIDEKALKALVRDAVTFNMKFSALRASRKTRTPSRTSNRRN